MGHCAASFRFRLSIRSQAIQTDKRLLFSSYRYHLLLQSLQQIFPVDDPHVVLTIASVTGALRNHIPYRLQRLINPQLGQLKQRAKPVQLEVGVVT